MGIAYEAGIGGVRMLDGDVTDAVEARSLGLNNQHIDIYSARYTRKCTTSSIQNEIKTAVVFQNFDFHFFLQLGSRR